MMDKNLESIKNNAIDLLYLEPVIDKEIPFIIHHPFFDANPVYYVNKDGTIEYELIPMFDKDFDKIFNSCKQICNKYGIIVSHHQVNLYKGFKYDAIALQFNSLIDFKFCNFPTY